MTNNERTFQYLRSFINSGSRIIDGIEQSNAARNDVQPSVEPETGRFLELMIRITNAKRVLELGTSNGYSALWMLKALSENGGSLVTIDSKERLHLEAVENFREAGFENVKAVMGDAADELEKLEPGFDIIFQDCGKYLYPQLFKKTISLLRSGGLLIADDTLFSVNEGIRSNLGRFTDEYNNMVFNTEELLTSIIPIGHGITMSFKL
ncbi:MAG TPA: O-methyltransferase [Spirochaeta sp.]|nr:O-methyltransferase [Spirochaeta sp.]